MNASHADRMRRIAPEAELLGEVIVKWAEVNKAQVQVPEKECLKPLKPYFGASALNRISVDDVRRYVVERGRRISRTEQSRWKWLV
jgi:hypothetical protein